MARKLASSGAVGTVNELYNIPFSIKLFFDLFSIGSKKKKYKATKSLVRNYAMPLKIWEPPL